MLAIPPKILNTIGNPSGFKIEVNLDKSINLVPIYACIVLIAAINFMVQIAWYYHTIVVIGYL